MTRSPRRAAWLVASASLVCTAVVASAATPSVPGTTPHDRDLVGVIVKLDAEPVATYRGGVAGLAATSRAVTGARRLATSSSAVLDYRRHLARRIATFEGGVRSAIRGARVLHRYDVVVGGVAMLVPESALPTLRALPGVRAVYTDERRRIASVSSGGLIGARALWGKVGGVDQAGEGVVIGVLDTGIWPEHPSFADPGPDGKPFVAPPGTRACQLDGGANPGAPFACNGKLIGAYRFLEAYDACAGCEHPPDEFSSARDSVGHGTHTASTAAGHAGVVAAVRGTALGQIAGIAPRAQLIAYKVCGPADDGCFASDSVAAIQQAILDGVDVINFSIGGGTNPYDDPVELAFRDAYAAGIFVAASAGNDGPYEDTVEHLGPWVTTVAASSARRELRSAVLLEAPDGARLKLTGGSLGAGLASAAPVRRAAAAGDARCEDDTPDAAFAGAIVVCERGGGARAAKSRAVARRGAVGMILYNDPADPSQRGLASDDHFVPTVHLEFDDGEALLAFLADHPGTTATLGRSMAARTRSDVIATFSSRGGAGNPIGVLKPDVAAPGVQILAGDTPQHADPSQRDGALFQVSDGTSMAAPHVAGAAALLAGARPDWTPGRIKSALLTSAATRRVVDDDLTPFDPFDAGSGRVQLQRALDPGLTFDVPVADYVAHELDLWTVNQPSVFLPADAPAHVVLTRRPRSEVAQATTWEVAITAPPEVVIMAPPSVALAGNATTTFPIAIDKSAVPPEEARHAVLELKHRNQRVRIPITVVGARLPAELRPTSLTASSPLKAGGTVTLASTIANDGPGRARAFYVSFYLSADAAYSADDVMFAVCNYPFGLDAGKTTSCTGTLPFQPVAPVAPGAYRVVMAVDSALEVAETDETNNVAVTPAPVIVQ
jgi:subtilisin family serine protease